MSRSGEHKVRWTSENSAAIQTAQPRGEWWYTSVASRFLWLMTLCRGDGHWSSFLSTISDGSDNFESRTDRSKATSSSCCGSFARLQWMNSRTMVAIDTSERAHVIDVRSEEELEVLDLVDVQLAYATSFYKSLATGGNVSQALVRETENTASAWFMFLCWRRS